MKYNEKKGNLFELDMDKYVFAHCISLDCEMGEGIAKTFKKKFKGLQSYCKFCVNYDEGSDKYPQLIIYYKGRTTNESVFNLVTKKYYWNKPTYQSLEWCIQSMYEHCKAKNIKYLAIPKLGCGLDRLQWGKVREFIQYTFKDLDIEIEVRYL